MVSLSKGASVPLALPGYSLGLLNRRPHTGTSVESVASSSQGDRPRGARIASVAVIGDTPRQIDLGSRPRPPNTHREGTKDRHDRKFLCRGAASGSIGTTNHTYGSASKSPSTARTTPEDRALEPGAEELTGRLSDEEIEEIEAEKARLGRSAEAAIPERDRLIERMERAREELEGKRPIQTYAAGATLDSGHVRDAEPNGQKLQRMHFDEEAPGREDSERRAPRMEDEREDEILEDSDMDTRLVHATDYSSLSEGGPSRPVRKWEYIPSADSEPWGNVDVDGRADGREDVEADVGGDVGGR